MCCGNCGSICLVGCCPSITDCFCGGCLTGAPCVVACPGACPAVQAAFCGCPTTAGSNVDLGNLPLTAPSGDPALDGLTPSSSASDTAPATKVCASAPRGGGSGGGTAKASGSGGGPSIGAVPHSTQMPGTAALSNALSRFGTSLATLFGKTQAAKTGLEQKTVNAVTTPAFLFVILIVGVLLLLIAFGRKGD